MKSRTQNVTLSLPVSLLRQFRVYAAEQNQSMSSIVTRAIREIVQRRDDGSTRAGRELVEHFRNAPSRGTGGKITWTREQLYERMSSEKSK